MVTIHWLLIGMVFVLCVTFCSMAQDGSQGGEIVLPAKKKFHLFLLAGQSNMAGRGEVEEQDLEPDERVLMLERDGTWRVAIDPIHYDKPMAGVGLGKSFGKVVADREPGVVVGLIPAACGGSNIGVWKPGEHFNQTDSFPYDDAVKRTKRAMEDGVLKGILWHQGEGDSRRERAEVYQENLEQLIARFRKEFGDEHLPFVIGQLGQFEGKPWSEWRRQVNDAHVAVAESDEYAGFVSSEGLTCIGDQLHFNSRSLREFGRRYAKVYFEIVERDDEGGD